MHTIKPIDSETIAQAAIDCGAIVTAEEAQIIGGMGSLVAQIVAKNHPVPIEFVGVTDTFGGSGTPDELMNAFGLTHTYIYNSVKKVLHRKNNGGLGRIQPVTEVGMEGQAPHNYPKPGETFPIDQLVEADRKAEESVA